jgi:inosine/xanthosine triphosphate pyrophosphatase family protein
VRERAKTAASKRARAEHMRDSAQAAVDDVHAQLAGLGIEPGQLAEAIKQTRKDLEAEAAKVEAALAEAEA